MFKLYAFAPTRSVRPKWALQELGLQFQEIDGSTLKNDPEYKKIHPLGKIPALEHNGKILFESVAIVNYLADMHPEANLIPRVGTYERALHDQWSAFALSELEAWVWSTVKNLRMYPEAQRVPAVAHNNSLEFKKSAAVIEQVLTKQPYMLGERFSATDINVAYVLNWGRGANLVGELPKVNDYLDRLHQRPASPLQEQTDFFKSLR